MSKRPDLAHLVVGLVALAFVFVLALVHVQVPDVLPYSALALFGIAGGVTVPRAAPGPPAAAAPADTPAAPYGGGAAGALARIDGAA